MSEGDWECICWDWDCSGPPSSPGVLLLVDFRGMVLFFLFAFLISCSWVCRLSVGKDEDLICEGISGMWCGS